MQPMLSQSSSSLATEENIEYPILVLTQQPDSHHFNERRIVLNDTIKVGRSVARARPCESNAIFDCKVLSRNHAIFWFDNGKVWLKDTKSSNGTFVNSQLLSKGTEDSAPREIYSGDIIQFGVEVVENTTTHGCIIAQTTIFLSDGNELRRHSDMGGIPSGNIPISNYYEEQIYQLAQYIQEASHREQTLEKKLNSLSQLIVDTQEASDSSWKVILNQDRLMEKLELLQEQVDMHAKGDDHESLTAELQRVLEQRYGLERESKSLLEGLMEEKTDVLQRVVDLEQSLGASEEECAQLRAALDTLQSEHGHITERLSSGKDEVEVLHRRLEGAQTEYNSEIGRLSHDRDLAVARYEELCAEAQNLRGQLEEAEATHAHVDKDVLRDLMRQSSERQAHLDSSMVSIERQLCTALVSEILALQNLQQFEESVTDNEASLDSFIVGTTSDLALHFIESHRQIKMGVELISLLRDELLRLQQVIHHVEDDTNNVLSTIVKEADEDEHSSVVVDGSLHEMEILLDKMDDCQTRTKTIMDQIPERLMMMLHSSMEDNVCHMAIQTDFVSMVHTAMQHSPKYIDTVAVQVDLVDKDVSDKDQSEVMSLQQCIENLQAEKKVTESLKIELLQLQDEKRRLVKRSEELSTMVEELRQEASSMRQDVESRRDSVQRVANEGYGHLYQESQELRKRVQEIEEEMSHKRDEYDVLYEQYETLITSQKNNMMIDGQDNDDGDASGSVSGSGRGNVKIRELEELCSRQQIEMDEMRDSMSSNYQTLVARARKISALSVIPLCVLLVGIIISIISLLGRPWLLSSD